MSTIRVVDPADQATLLPGFYWIEMAFDRPASEEILLRALRAIGFDSVGIEVDESPARIGAISATTSKYGTSIQAAQAAPTTIQAATASPTVATTTAAPRTQTVAPTPYTHATATAAPTTTYRAPQAGVDVRAPDVRAPVRAPTTTATAYQAPTTAQTAAPVRRSFTSPTFGDSGAGPGGAMPGPRPGTYGIAATYEPGTYEAATAHPAGTPYADEEPPPEEAPGPYTGAGYVPSEGGGGGGGGGGAMADEGGYGAPSATATAAPETRALAKGAPVPGAVLINPGSPVAWWLLPKGTAPGTVSVSGRSLVGGAGGEGLGGPATTVHFVGQLGEPIDVTARPGLRWSAIHTLAFDPWGPMSFQLTPHELKHGQMYDLRFLSRDKSARSKKDVRGLLLAMGFSPALVFLAKRNVRIPRRPLTTLSEWFGVGVWNGPDSVIVSSDPFYFAEVRATS